MTITLIVLGAVLGLTAIIAAPVRRSRRKKRQAKLLKLMSEAKSASRLNRAARHYLRLIEAAEAGDKFAVEKVLAAKLFYDGHTDSTYTLLTKLDAHPARLHQADARQTAIMRTRQDEQAAAKYAKAVSKEYAAKTEKLREAVNAWRAAMDDHDLVRAIDAGLMVVEIWDHRHPENQVRWSMELDFDPESMWSALQAAITPRSEELTALYRPTAREFRELYDLVLRLEPNTQACNRGLEPLIRPPDWNEWVASYIEAPTLWDFLNPPLYHKDKRTYFLIKAGDALHTRDVELALMILAIFDKPKPTPQMTILLADLAKMVAQVRNRDLLSNYSQLANR